MRIDNYIQPGDEIAVVYRSLSVQGFTGRVLHIGEGTPGERELLIERRGENVVDGGAIGVREDRAVFDVRRGESWVSVPCLLTKAEADAKAMRSVVNERKRIARKVPLFADQIETRTVTAEQWMENVRLSGEEALERDHDAALQATSLRDQVRALVNDSEYLELVAARERFASSALYGIYFWRKQLEHIRDTGGPSIFRPQVNVAERLSFPWLRPDARLNWVAAPGGPQRVRVLFIGSTEILVRLVGEPISDYDPRLIPDRNVWLPPEAFEESALTTGRVRITI